MGTKERRKKANELMNGFLHDVHWRRKQLEDEKEVMPGFFGKIFNWFAVTFFGKHPFNVKMDKIQGLNDLADDVKAEYHGKPGDLTRIIERHSEKNKALSFSFIGIFTSRTSKVLNKAKAREQKDPDLAPGKGLEL